MPPARFHFPGFKQTGASVRPFGQLGAKQAEIVALAQAHKGRMEILDNMETAISEPRPDVSELLEVPVERGIKRGVDTRFAGVQELILEKGNGALIKYHYSRTAAVEAPVEKGQVLGYVTMSIGGEVIGNAKITAAESVPRLDLARCFDYMIKAFFSY